MLVAVGLGLPEALTHSAACFGLMSTVIFSLTLHVHNPLFYSSSLGIAAEMLTGACK
ncbi:hypothetical protein EJ03DRAFT_324958 [Teratosphaeria nubilosa]|uniref:Uncharacterized protein n=1 Tax=Teratosphaeria nubilosa TaxID=161662 RepID=A0A6G1LGW2_9PEZI|nr:hypothetical protein EJ03DRAFT_324958 [Teratosphaeria nubilosa]